MSEKIETVEEVTKTPANNLGNDGKKREKLPSNPVIKNDILRYKKNKLGANLALLGIVFACVYFIVLYAQVKNGGAYYTWAIAFDVIYNLFFLLFVFLFSEQVKNYNRKLFIVQLIVGLLQIARIFWLPLFGITHTFGPEGQEATVISAGVFITMTVSLAVSGALVIASAVIGFVRSKSVENFAKQLEDGEIDLDAALKEETAGGNANA